ncbi:hypothetical protein TRVL_09400 [Trypanosoma vivax]|nr:hypothetical protein TRVL_09400 [Trypanosoma vivax]
MGHKSVLQHSRLSAKLANGNEITTTVGTAAQRGTNGEQQQEKIKMHGRAGITASGQNAGASVPSGGGRSSKGGLAIQWHRQRGCKRKKICRYAFSHLPKHRRLANSL